MRLQLKRALLACALVLVGVSSAYADEASGTWTGELEGRGNYYYERSTRVFVPTFKVTAEAPNGVHLSADYLVDVISSASIAQTGGGADGVFTELRHGIGASVGKEFDMGGAQLDLTVHGRYSTESDYESRVYGLSSALSWNEKTTTLTLNLNRVDDSVYSNVMPKFEGRLYGLTSALSLSQVVTSRLILGVGYQLGYLEGFLANPYRRALIGPRPYAEKHPGERFRHNIEGSLAWFIPASNTTLSLAYRVYVDSWDIMAVTPEARIYQELGENFVLRARYRFYTQTRAYFYESPRYPLGYTGYVSNDPKMAEFHSQQVGLKLEYRLAFLGGSFLDFARDAWLDLSVDRQFSTASYGNNIIATVGGRVPF